MDVQAIISNARTADATIMKGFGLYVSARTALINLAKPFVLQAEQPGLTGEQKKAACLAAIQGFIAMVGWHWPDGFVGEILQAALGLAIDEAVSLLNGEGKLSSGK